MFDCHSVQKKDILLFKYQAPTVLQGDLKRCSMLCDCCPTQLATAIAQFCMS